MTHISGGWARERQVVTRKLDDGLTGIKSSRGASSHQFNPYMVITPNREPDEKSCKCYSFCLVYPGSFLATSEVTEYSRLRVNMGINPDGFSWHLNHAGKAVTNGVGNGNDPSPLDAGDSTSNGRSLVVLPDAN
jgi:alpha-galactosidase